MISGWTNARPRQLKKVVFAMSEEKLKKLIINHEVRGWKTAGDVKKYGYGLGCQMVWDKR